MSRGCSELLPAAPTVVAITGEPRAILPHGRKGLGHHWATLTFSVGTLEPRFCPCPRQPLNLSNLGTLASTWVWQLENWLFFPDGGGTEALPTGRGVQILRVTSALLGTPHPGQHGRNGSHGLCGLRKHFAGAYFPEPPSPVASSGPGTPPLPSVPPLSCENRAAATGAGSAPGQLGAAEQGPQSEADSELRACPSSI